MALRAEPGFRAASTKRAQILVLERARARAELKIHPTGRAQALIRSAHARSCARLSSPSAWLHVSTRKEGRASFPQNAVASPNADDWACTDRNWAPHVVAHSAMPCLTGSDAAVEVFARMTTALSLSRNPAMGAFATLTTALSLPRNPGFIHSIPAVEAFARLTTALSLSRNPAFIHSTLPRWRLSRR